MRSRTSFELNKSNASNKVLPKSKTKELNSSRSSERKHHTRDSISKNGEKDGIFKLLRENSKRDPEQPSQNSKRESFRNKVGTSHDYLSANAPTILDTVEAKLNLNEWLLLIFYSGMTICNICEAVMVWYQYFSSPCNISVAILSDVTLWPMMVLSQLFKLLSIIFFRYDLVHERAEIKGIMIWRPFVLPLILIGIGPSSIMPLYTFNFEQCSYRSRIFSMEFSFYFQTTFTFFALFFILYMAIMSKIIQDNSKAQAAPKKRSANASVNRSLTASFGPRDSSEILPCLLIVNRFSKYVGVVVTSLALLLSLLTLTVMRGHQFLRISLGELLQLCFLIALIIGFKKLKL